MNFEVIWGGVLHRGRRPRDACGRARAVGGPAVWQEHVNGPDARYVCEEDISAVGRSGENETGVPERSRGR